MIGVILTAKIVMLFVISNCVAGTTIDQYGQDVPIVRPCWLSTHGWVIVNDTTPSHTEEKVEKVPSLPPPPIDDSSESLAELKHGKLDASSPTITNNSHFDVMSYIIIGVVAILAIAIVKRSDTPKIPTVITDEVPITKTTRHYTEDGVDVEETLTEKTVPVRIDDEFLQQLKNMYPRDYAKVLKWISNNPDDVKIILKNSEADGDKIKEMVRKSREAQDWSDLR